MADEQSLPAISRENACGLAQAHRCNLHIPGADRAPDMGEIRKSLAQAIDEAGADALAFSASGWRARARTGTTTRAIRSPGAFTM